MAATAKTCSKIFGANFMRNPNKYWAYHQVRHLIGKPYDEAQSLEQRLSAQNRLDPELDKPINIGFPYNFKKIGIRETRALRIKNCQDPEMEKMARLKQLTLPLDTVNEEYQKEVGPLHIKTLAKHYGIFRDLFDNAFFVPVIQLHIAYDYDEEYVTPVYRGNRIPAAEATNTPHVHWEAESDSLWTLVLTSPDSNFHDNDAEVLHWMVGNIPGNDISSGDIICDYLQPFPVKGTGWHRLVFLLYKQNHRIDYSAEKRQGKGVQERTFNTLEFYRHLQDDITPAGLSWFQCEWDDCVRAVFHKLFNMKDPSFDYEFPEPYHPKQVKYPHKEAFNRYLDRYRDKKEIKEQVLKERIKMIHPFKEESKLFKYPNIYQLPVDTAQWIKTETNHRQLKRMKWKWLNPLVE